MNKTTEMMHAAGCASVHDCNYIFCTGKCNCHVKVIRELRKELESVFTIISDNFDPNHYDHQLWTIEARLYRLAKDYFDKKGKI